MSNPRAESSLRYDAGLLLVVLIWGLNFPIIKVPLEVMPPFAVNAIRFSISAVVLALLWAREARSLGPHGFSRHVLQGRALKVVLLGILGHVSYQVCFILGVARTEAGSAALIIASAPIWTAVLSRAMGLERLTLKQGVGLAVSLAGVALVILAARGDGPTASAPDPFWGNLLVLLGAVFWAAYTVLSKPVLSEGVSGTGLSFWTVLAATPVLVGLGMPTFEAVTWSTVSPEVWAALVFSGGLSTGLAYAIWNVAVRQLGPSPTAAFSNLVPFVALVASALLLGEPIRLAQVIGGVLIIGGVVLVRRGGR